MLARRELSWYFKNNIKFHSFFELNFSDKPFSTQNFTLNLKSICVFFQITINYRFGLIINVWKVFSKWVEVWADLVAEAELEVGVKVEVFTAVALEIAEAIVGARVAAAIDAIDHEIAEVIVAVGLIVGAGARVAAAIDHEIAEVIVVVGLIVAAGARVAAAIDAIALKIGDNGGIDPVTGLGDRIGLDLLVGEIIRGTKVLENW